MIKILVPVRGDGKGDNVIAHAAALAHRTDSHLAITHCRARPEDMLPFGVPIPRMFHKQIMQQAEDIADVEEEEMKKELKALAEKLGLSLNDGAAPGKGVTASWTEESGRMADVIRRHGRLSDLIAVPQPDVDRNLGWNVMKTAMYRTIRPVLMVPNGVEPPENLGRSVTIGWDGSLEASKAVTMTLPILRAAEQVTILSSGGEPAAATADDLVAYLAAHGIPAEIHRFKGQGNVGRILLSASKEVGADLLIMGAYGESQEKEHVFGGNTQHIIDNGKMPVIFVH